MTWFTNIGKIYQYADDYIDNRIELTKLELSANTAKVISRSVTLGLFLFIGAIIYVLILMIAVIFLNSYINSLLITLLCVLGFHILLLVGALFWQKTFFNGFITNYLAVSFTDVEDGATQLSLEDYKTSLQAKNQYIVDHIKGDIKSLFFLDKLENLMEEENVTDEANWDDQQNAAFEQIKEIIVDIFNDSEVVEAAEKVSPTNTI
ncbi:MAG TPA: hypothetical protein PLY70_19855 [Saprospiraceae bacterium]|nr:hypothetical protein [Saprospiraceae bacterium]